MVQISQTIVDYTVLNSQCCYVSTMTQALNLMQIGDPSWKEVYWKAWYIGELINGLRSYDITSDCIPCDMLCDAVTSLQSICSSCC